MTMMAERWVKRAALGAWLLLAGCGASSSREARVAGDFSGRRGCTASQVKIKQERGGFAVSGCGWKDRYDCFSDGCQLADAPVLPPSADAPRPRRVTELRLQIGLGAADGLLLTATPEEGENAELALDSYPQRDCGLDVMIDGQLLELAEGSARWSRVLPRDVVLELGAAQQVAVRACDHRWSLSREDLLQIRRFARRYAEELAWREPARKGSTGGHRPPTGGWQPWQAAAAFPGATASVELTGAQLFQKLAPSVWRVESQLESGSSQGSAVAVTKSTLVTNCHVVAGALKIVLRQAKLEVTAKLKASDPAKDRCVLEVVDAQLVPVAGVRPYVDLKVGEALYTLGAPSGLELTLANGILSALREDEGVRYVQTSAPISPGSSGGGLFDARGNLVGVTTLVFVGKEHLNQSLNFAIAAEMFWSP